MNTRINKMFSILALIFLIGSFLIVYILGRYYPGYNPYKQVMSVLGNKNSPVHRFYNIWLIFLGIIIINIGNNFYIKYKNVSKILSLIGTIAITINGIGGCILSGIFIVNEIEGTVNIYSKIHGLSTSLGFMVLIFFPIIIGLLYKNIGNIVLKNISIIIFIMNLIFFALYVLSEKEQFIDTIIGNRGLWQRILIGSAYMPLIIINIKNIIKPNEW